MVYADTNICLRFILNDNEEMADFAETLLTTEEVYLLHEVIAEIVYVLNRVYNVARAKICLKISALLEYAKTADQETMRQALRIYAETSLDFVDCILLAYNKTSGAKIATFDKKLKNKLTDPN